MQFTPDPLRDRRVTRRRRILRPNPLWKWVMLGFGLPLLCSSLSCTQVESGRPERIILIVVDTLRADRVGVYGGKAATPHMDGLARKGQKFTQARSAFHFTTMSMGSLFTGHVPSLESGRDNRSLGYTNETLCGMARFRTSEDAACLPQKLETLAEALREDGYWTLAVVGNPLLFDPWGYSQGFDEWIEVGRIPGGLFRTGSTLEHALERTGDLINAAVFKALSERPSDHFFLFAHYLDVHDWPSRNQAYIHGVEVFDAYLGELLSYLDDQNLLEGTAIVLTSDHGEALGEKHVQDSLGLHFGNPSYEPVLRVPLIVYPARFADPDVPIRGQDMKSLVLSLSQPQSHATERVTPQTGSELFISELKYQTLQTGRWKSFWPRDGAEPILVDLENDPGETMDLAAEKPDILLMHRSRLDALAREHWTDPDSLFLDFSEEDRQRLRALGYLEQLDPQEP